MHQSPAVAMPTASGRYPVVLAICLAALVLPLSFTGGAVATPAIGVALRADAMAMAWITNAFMLSFGSLLMAAGALADRYGRKRLFLAGVAGFTLVSLLLAGAPSILWFDGLRAAQGVAAAAALAGGSAALAQEFEGPARTRVFSLLGTTFGLGLAFGPLLAGILLDEWGWRAIFLGTAMLAGSAALVAWKWLRESRDPQAGRLDVPGVLSFSSTLIAFTSAIILGPRQGWASLAATSLFLLAAFGLLLFVRGQLRSQRPMLDVRLFRLPRFLGVQLLPIGTCVCYIVFIVLLPLRLIGVEGLGATQAGLILLALTLPLLVVPLLTAWLTRWLSAGCLCALGFLLAAAGLLALSHLPVGGEWPVLLCLIVIGVGTGLPWGLMDGLAIGVVPRERAGMVAGIFNTVRVASEGVALAIAFALLSALIERQLTHSLVGWSAPARLALAQQVALGDLKNLPLATSGVLQRAYLHSFDTLLQGASLVTALIGLVTLVMLRPARPS
ncbi:MFS transporter [Pseudomonas sp. EpS/L25]|uniref:MFS transporter n=1 Tax=Pseudomonas sp. EpS/L25 TaxID=1749078 RepID=UPI0007444EC6|nr:MFS transporter [Pseudomonas sp. EpS/L25]KUM39732.1 MFS transporter [Pseudomonas sp. EpS/L25]